MKLHEPRILCIDNDADTCDWMRVVLWNSIPDCTVTAAESGRAAFKLLNSEEFDLCILDYALPDMTGAQLCALLRQMGYDLPVMFFSAMNRPIDRAKAEAVGADEYLSKADDLNIFADKAMSLIKKRPQIYDATTRFGDLAKAA